MPWLGKEIEREPCRERSARDPCSLDFALRTIKISERFRIGNENFRGCFFVIDGRPEKVVEIMGSTSEGSEQARRPPV